MFKPIFIQGKTLGDTWFQLLSSLWSNGREYLITNGSHAGETRLSFDMVSGFIEYPHQRPLAPILPPTIQAIPTTDDDIEKYFQNYLMNPNLSPGEEYRYSLWINDNIKNPYTGKFITAIEWVIEHFKKVGYGNAHCYINIGSNMSNFEYDKPYKNETERGTSPCLRGLDFKIKDYKLLIGVIYRSWDLYGGWPENMGGFTLLNEYVCEMLGDVFYGPMAFFSMDLHCYKHQIGALKSVLNIKE